MQRMRARWMLVGVGFLSVLLLPLGATVDAATNCEQQLVGKTFQCHSIHQSGTTAADTWQFTAGGLGEFTLTTAEGTRFGCSCRALGILMLPLFDQDTLQFLCAAPSATPSVVPGSNEANALVGLVMGGVIRAEEVLAAPTDGGLSTLHRCQ